MKNFLRAISQFIFKNGLTVKFVRWNLGKESLTETAKVLFPDGIIAINKDGKAWISQFQSDNFALLVDGAEKLITDYSLKDGDVFVGRNRNYLLFRNGDLKIKCATLEIDCNNIEILTNEININGVILTFVDGKILINSKEVAVVGGDISVLTSKITTSGQ